MKRQLNSGSIAIHAVRLQRPFSMTTLLTNAEPPKRAIPKGGKMVRSSGYQNGYLFQRGTRRKVWVVRWREDVVGEDGTLLRVRRSEILGPVTQIPTRRAAQRLLLERLQAINSGKGSKLQFCTFREFVQNRWIPVIYPTLKYSTKKQYDYIFKVHLEPAFGDMQLTLITRDLAQSFLNGKLRSGLAWKTVKHFRTALGTILGAAEMHDLISENPVKKTRLPRRPIQSERTAISLEQIQKVLSKLPQPSRSIGSLIVVSGLRIGEVLALRWKDIDFDSRVLRVNQTVYEGHFDEPKTRRSRRTVPLSPATIQILQQHLPSQVDADALLFGTRKGAALSRRNLLNRQLLPTCKQLGLEGINWHWLRHANASLLDACGAPVGTIQDLLGHASPGITRGTYIHGIPEESRKAVDRVSETVFGPKWTQVPEVQGLGESVIN
jgi:integrase